MPDERYDRSTKRAATYMGFSEHLAVVRAELALLPTRNELARRALLATLTGAALVIAGMELLLQ